MRRIPRSCHNHPCAYWGIWSSWGMCSTTCGEGTRQRMRKCEGGAPGSGLCLPSVQELDEAGLPFMPQGAGALHIEKCQMGECCEMEWSGWSNCCSEKGQGKRLRWKGNTCTADWVEKTEGCQAGTETDDIQT